MKNIWHDIEIDKWIMTDDRQECVLEFDPTESNSFMELHNSCRNELSLTASFSAYYNTLKYRVHGVMQSRCYNWDDDCQRHELVLLCKTSDGEFALVWLYVNWPHETSRQPYLVAYETQAVVFKFAFELIAWRKTVTHMVLETNLGFLSVPRKWFRPCITGNKSIQWVAEEG